MVERKVNSPDHLNYGQKKNLRHPLKIARNTFFPDFFLYSSYSLCIKFSKIKCQILDPYRVYSAHQKLGVYSKLFK